MSGLHRHHWPFTMEIPMSGDVDFMLARLKDYQRALDAASAAWCRIGVEFAALPIGYQVGLAFVSVLGCASIVLSFAKR